MWYSSKSRNEKAERPSKVENTVSYPVNFEEHINGMHARNINRNKKKRLLNNRAITYCLLFFLLVVTVLNLVINLALKLCVAKDGVALRGTSRCVHLGLVLLVVYLVV